MNIYIYIYVYTIVCVSNWLCVNDIVCLGSTWTLFIHYKKSLGIYVHISFHVRIYIYTYNNDNSNNNNNNNDIICIYIYTYIYIYIHTCLHVCTGCRHNVYLHLLTPHLYRFERVSQGPQGHGGGTPGLCKAEMMNIIIGASIVMVPH